MINWVNNACQLDINESFKTQLTQQDQWGDIEIDQEPSDIHDSGDGRASNNGGVLTGHFG